MNYRDYNPINSCLPAEAYPYLALALAEPQEKPVSRLTRFWRWLVGATPVLVAAAFLPLADLEGDYFRPGPDSRIHSLVWVQPLPGKKLPQPPTLPRVDGNPFSF